MVDVIIDENLDDYVISLSIQRLSDVGSCAAKKFLLGESFDKESTLGNRMIELIWSLQNNSELCLKEVELITNKLMEVCNL